jgi:hypothetical protein
MSVFHMWMVGYHRLKNTHQYFFIIRILNLMFYKTDFGVFKFKSPLLKSKLNLLNKKIFLDFFNIHINHLFTNFLDQHDIKVALHKYFEKIDNFLIVWHGFWFIWQWLHPGSHQDLIIYYWVLKPLESTLSLVTKIITFQIKGTMFIQWWPKCVDKKKMLILKQI